MKEKIEKIKTQMYFHMKNNLLKQKNYKFKYYYLSEENKKNFEKMLDVFLNELLENMKNGILFNIYENDNYKNNNILFYYINFLINVHKDNEQDMFEKENFKIKKIEINNKKYIYILNEDSVIELEKEYYSNSSYIYQKIKKAYINYIWFNNKKDESDGLEIVNFNILCSNFIYNSLYNNKYVYEDTITPKNLDVENYSKKIENIIKKELKDYGKVNKKIVLDLNKKHVFNSKNLKTILTYMCNNKINRITSIDSFFYTKYLNEKDYKEIKEKIKKELREYLNKTLLLDYEKHKEKINNFYKIEDDLYIQEEIKKEILNKKILIDDSKNKYYYINNGKSSNYILLKKIKRLMKLKQYIKNEKDYKDLIKILYQVEAYILYFINSDTKLINNLLKKLNDEETINIEELIKLTILLIKYNKTNDNIPLKEIRYLLDIHKQLTTHNINITDNILIDNITNNEIIYDNGEIKKIIESIFVWIFQYIKKEKIDFNKKSLGEFELDKLDSKTKIDFLKILKKNKEVKKIIDKNNCIYDLFSYWY